MPLTMENARACATAVERAKAPLGGPGESGGKDAFLRYMAAAYAAPLRGRWLIPQTVAEAFSQRNGNPAAVETLKILVYDPRLTAALTGQNFTMDEWREMYIKSGLMDAQTFDLFEREGASSREASQ